jgi:energy-converting hydrogenase Eha subunit A
LRNYLEYPLVASAILASIPVFEVHETLDLMEKAVTLLSGYLSGLERSVLVALAVRMIHGVRNELVRKIDPTATITPTPIQFTYAPHPGLFVWFRPVIIAHASYHATFSGMGGFHPAHSHGVGGFVG